MRPIISHILILFTCMFYFGTPPCAVENKADNTPNQEINKEMHANLAKHLPVVLWLGDFEKKDREIIMDLILKDKEVGAIAIIPAVFDEVNLRADDRSVVVLIPKDKLRNRYTAINAIINAMVEEKRK